MSSSHDDRVTSVRLPREVLARVDEVAAARGRASRSSVIREVLARGLDQLASERGVR